LNQSKSGSSSGIHSLIACQARFDGFYRLDIERRRQWPRALDDAFPQTAETEEEFDLLGPVYCTYEFHGSFVGRDALSERFASVVPGRGSF